MQLCEEEKQRTKMYRKHEYIIFKINIRLLENNLGLGTWDSD